MHGSTDDWKELFLYPIHLMICTILLPILAVVGIAQLIKEHRREKKVKEKQDEQS